jgi:ketosteroid isomerase-like protein
MAADRPREDEGMSDQTVADRLAIRELIERYSDALTRRAWDEMAAGYHEDAVWTVAAPFGLEFRTRNGIREGIRQQVEAMEFLVQMTHSIVIDLQGEAASACTVTHEMARNSQTQTGLFLLGTYNDQITRRDGRWGFTRRFFQPIFASTDWLPGMVVKGDLSAA